MPLPEERQRRGIARYVTPYLIPAGRCRRDALWSCEQAPPHRVARCAAYGALVGFISEKPNYTISAEDEFNGDPTYHEIFLGEDDSRSSSRRIATTL